MFERLNRLSKFTKEAFLNEVEESLNNNSKHLEDLQKEQWLKGLNKEGKIIGLYSKRTEQIAKKESPIMPKKAGSPYNLQWSGDMFNKTRAIIKKTNKDVDVDVVSFSKNVNPLKKTINKFGLVNSDSIHGLIDNNKKKFNKLLNQELKLKFKKYGL